MPQGSAYANPVAVCACKVAMPKTQRAKKEFAPTPETAVLQGNATQTAAYQVGSGTVEQSSRATRGASTTSIAGDDFSSSIAATINHWQLLKEMCQGHKKKMLNV